MKLTDEQIEKCVKDATARFLLSGATVAGVAEAAARAALALAEQPEPPALLPWPKLPIHSETVAGVVIMVDAADNDVAQGIAVFSVNMLPRLVTMLQEERRLSPGGARHDPDSYFARRDALLAEIDAAGFDLPKGDGK